MRVERMLAVGWVGLLAAVAPGCDKASCADYHDPACWTPPPPPADGGDAAVDGDGGPGGDAGTDVGETPEASPDGGD